MPETHVQVPPASEVNPIIDPHSTAHGADTHGAADHGASATGAHGEAKPAQVQRSFTDKLLRRPGEAPKPTTPPEAPKLSQADIVHGGSTRAEVKFDKKTTDALVDTITARIKVAEMAQGRGNEISDIDKHLLSSGIIDKIKSGNLTPDDYFTALAAVNSDLLEKSAMMGIIGPKDPKTPGPRGLNIPYVQDVPQWSTILGKATDRAGNPLTLQPPGNPDGKTYVASEYAQELNYIPDVPEIMRLNDLRIKLFEAARGPGSKDPLMDSVNISVYPTQLLNSRHYFYGEMGRQVQQILASEFPPGTTPESVWTADRPKMAEILIRANQETFKFMVRGRAEQVLREPANISSAAINERANELRAKPKPEELAPLTDAKTKADEAFIEAEEKLNKLKKDIPTTEQKIRDKKEELDTAQAVFNEQKDIINTDIDRLIAESNAIIAKMGALTATIVPTPGKGETLVNPADAQGRKHEEIENRIATKRAELAALSLAVTKATLSHTSAEDELDRLRGVLVPAVPASGTTPGTPEHYAGIKAAEDAYNTSKAEANTAKTNLDNMQKAIDGKSVDPKKEMLASELVKWDETYINIGPVRTNLLKQTASSPYSIRNLRDTTVSANGRIAGFDKIREAIFFAGNPSKPLDPEQYARMASDEALASQILRTYKVRTSTLVGIDTGIPFDTLTESLKDYEDQIERLSAIATPTTADLASLENFKNLKQAASIDIRKTALAQISERGGTVKLAELAHEIIIKGAQSATRGEPKLRI